MDRRIALPVLLLAAITLAAAPAPTDRRAETLASGESLLRGVTLDASTPIATINSDPAAYEGTLVQVEGEIVEICSAMGCWTEIKDDADNRLRLKVEDGVVDLRDLISETRYIVAEGIFQQQGEHGAQVFIGDHGAVVAKK